jgi:putative heme-binding domain-containing protein
LSSAIPAFALLSLPALCFGQAPTDNSTKLDDYRSFALSQQADADRGKALFFNEAKLACSKCHTLNGSSGKAGPDLYAIGDKYPRPALIDAILQPSANIAVGYTTTIVTTHSGDEYTGILQNINDAGLDLMGADGILVHVAKRDLKEQRSSPISLMPEGLQAALSLQEFNDLIEFLISLRQPLSAQRGDNATPSVIPELATPIRVTPLFEQTFTTPRIEGVESGLTGFAMIPGQTNVGLVTHQVGYIWLIEKSRGQERKALFRDQVSENLQQDGPKWPARTRVPSPVYSESSVLSKIPGV